MGFATRNLTSLSSGKLNKSSPRRADSVYCSHFSPRISRYDKIVVTTTVKGFEYGMIRLIKSWTFSFMEVFGKKPNKTEGILLKQYCYELETNLESNCISYSPWIFWMHSFNFNSNLCSVSAAINSRKYLKCSLFFKFFLTFFRIW